MTILPLPGETPEQYAKRRKEIIEAVYGKQPSFTELYLRRKAKDGDGPKRLQRHPWNPLPSPPP
jgi:hypothetical protein